MKKALLFIISFTFSYMSFSQTRYIDEVFSDVTVHSDVNYGTNVSVLPLLLGAPPSPTPLLCDIYEPSGDSLTDRPVVILAHTGVFLPPVINGQPTGSKLDSSIVEQCKRWAKKGYVAVAFNYRLGWNASSSVQEVRTATVIQAVYRGMQDARTVTRFMRSTHDNGNTYGINPSKIVLGGHGSGGYVSLAVATLDTAMEMYLPKFISPTNGQPFVIPQFYGNIFGTDSTFYPDSTPPFNSPVPLLMNIPNHENYSSDVNMAFNVGGALADISWLDDGGIPIVSFHCYKDPFAPIDTGDVVNPATGDFVVELMGSRTVQHYSNLYGNNDVFVNAGLSDAFTNAANINNDGYEGFYKFITPPPSTTPNVFGQYETEQASPWDWWNLAAYDTAWRLSPQTPAAAAIPGFGAANSLLDNPTMSIARGNTYIDTIQGYLNPRIYVALNLGNSTDIQNVILSSTQVYPNPANDKISISSYAVKINELDIYDISGKLVESHYVNANKININTSKLNSGIYFIEIKSDVSKIKKKVIIN